MSKFIAYNIDWDIDQESFIAAFEDMPYDKAAEKLGVPKETYANMTTSERNDYAYDVFRHNRKSAEDIFDLPEEIEIPEEFNITSENDDMEEVTDWISDTYGWCINRYDVKKAI